MREMESAAESATNAAPAHTRRLVRGWRLLRLAAGGAGIALLAVTASPALADSRATTDPSPSQWVGRYCTTRACGSARPAPLTHAAGFGVAVLGAIWLAGRRSAEN
jgi:hypothetical protein